MVILNGRGTSTDHLSWDVFGDKEISTNIPLEFSHLTVCVCVCVSQSYLTLCNPMDCSLPGSSTRGILQARILEWVAFPFFRRSSWPKDWTQVSCTKGRFFTIWATREAYHLTLSKYKYNLFITRKKGGSGFWSTLSRCYHKFILFFSHLIYHILLQILFEADSIASQYPIIWMYSNVLSYFLN